MALPPGDAAGGDRPDPPKLLGRRGPLGGFLHERFDLDVVFTWRAVAVAMAVMSFPLLVRTARVAFEKVDPLLEKSARTLGAGPAHVFFGVTLPLASGGVAGGTLLAFARALGEFGATILVAGNIPGRTTTLSLAIYNLVQLGKDDEAFRLLALGGGDRLRRRLAGRGVPAADGRGRADERRELFARRKTWKAASRSIPEFCICKPPFVEAGPS